MGHTFAFVLADIAVIIVVARLFGRIARHFRQPAVVGEIVAGIALGPSVLGLISVQIGDHTGPLNDHLFPSDVVPYLKILAQLGLVLFMFIVGLELDMTLIRGRERRAGTISLASIALPFALGAAATLVLHPLHDVVEGKPVSFLAMTLFMGVAMSITAFPVLARILTERRMHRTQVGVLALAAAAVDDVLAWTLLAFVIAVVSGGSPWSVARIVALSAVYTVVMFTVVRPLLARMLHWYRRAGRVTPDMLAIILVGILVSALITERIGIHEIFGAFLFGVIMPRQDAAAFIREILEQLEQMSLLLLLPIFFVVAGFGVNLRAFTDPGLLWQLGLILAVAIGGKFIGAFVAARAQRMPMQQSAAIGILMNTRGLTELVILLVGMQLGVLDTAMFTMMVVMALVTTAMTEPLLRIVYPDKAIQRDIDAAAKAALGAEQTTRALVLLDGPPGAATDRMIRLAAAASAGRDPREILLSRMLVASDDSELGAGLPDLAGMAEAVEELERFAERSSTSVPLKALCRFSAQPGPDLVAQVGTVGAEIVVVSADWVRRNPESFEALDEVIVLVVPADLPEVWLASASEAALAVSDAGTFVRDDGSADGSRAVLLGARAAAATGTSLTALTTDARLRKRLTHALEPLRSTSATVIFASTPDAGIHAVARVADRLGGSGINLRDEIAAVSG